MFLSFIGGKKKRMKVVPTVFARNKKEFDAKFVRVAGVKAAKQIQIDFMDGKFVSGRSVKLDYIPSLKKLGKRFEAHLMVEHPETWIPGLKKKGFERVLFHYGAYDDLDKTRWLVGKIKKEGLKAGVVFNPAVPFERVLEVVMFCKHVMFMGHLPGVEGKPLNPLVLKKIKRLRDSGFKGKIQVDGAVNDKTIVKLRDAGVDVVNVGSFISGAEDAGKAYGELKKLVR